MEQDAALSDLPTKPGSDWLIEAKRYLHGAEILRASRKPLLITPTLHLLGHGIELFLKANLILEGETADEARSFGHDIWRLWRDDRSATARRDVAATAEEEWNAAKLDPRWTDDFNEPATVQLEEYLRRLSQLHSRDTDYALRYPRPDGTEGPKPHLLVPTFERTADKYIREKL